MIVRNYKYNLITSWHVKLLFDHMLVNSLVYMTYCWLLIESHGEFTKVIV